MATFAVMLRAVNVGTHNRIGMADVRAALTKAGFVDPTTYLQSGNVIVSSTKRSADAVATEVEQALNAAMQLDVACVARSATQLAKIASAHPLGGPEVDPKLLHVGFLKRKPTPGALAALDFGRDEFVLRGTELYLRYEVGQGRSKMSGAAFERALGMPMTVRNWAVTIALAELVRA